MYPGLDYIYLTCSVRGSYIEQREVLNIFLLLVSIYFSTLSKIRDIFLETIKVSDDLNVQTWLLSQLWFGKVTVVASRQIFTPRKH